MLSAVVKVSNKSKIRLRNTKAYRAISWKELNYYIDNFNDSLNTIIVDGLLDDECDKLLGINLRGKEFNIPVVIYSDMQLSDKISEVCSENEIDVAVGLDNLQELLCNKFSEDVLTSGLLHTESKVIEEASDTAAGLFEELAESTSVIEDVDNETKNEKVTQDIADIMNAISANEDSAATTEEEESDIEVSETIKSKDDTESINIDNIFDDTEAEESESKPVINEDIQKELEEKDKIIADTNTRLENTLNRLKLVNNLRSVVEAERDELTKKLDKLALDKEVTEVVIGDSSKDEYEAQIAELNKTIEELNIQVSDIEQLNSRIDNLNKVIEVKESEQKQLEQKIEMLENDDSELNRYKEKFNNEFIARKELAGIIAVIGNKLVENKNLLDNKTKEYNDLLDESIGLQNNYTGLQSEIVELKATLSEKDDKIKEVANQYEKRINQIVSDSNQTNDKINQLEKEKEEVTGRLTQLQAKFRETSSKLIEANNKITELQSYDLNSLNTENDILGKTNDAMIGEVGVYQKRLNDAQDKLNKQEARIGNLRNQVEELTKTNASIMRASRFNNNITFECNYTGRANILSVCGSGSVGVTNTAISICNTLKGKILVLDLDVVSPKANEYLSGMVGADARISPMCKDLPDFPRGSEIYMSGLGAFIYKDIDYFIDNERLIIKNILRTRDNRIIDYVSGIYDKPNINMLMAADFSQLLTYLGNKYDYIVCDCGRVGGSEVQSAIQRMIDGICLKKILVARHEENDMRSLAIRIGNEKLSRNKSIWLLNLSRSNEMTTLMAKCLAKAPYVIFPYNDVIFGKGITFDKVRAMSAKLDELSNLVIRGM